MKFYPEPNVTVGVGATGTNNYSSPATTTDNYNNELGRLDYNLSDKNRMFFDVRTATETQAKNDYFANPGRRLAAVPQAARRDARRRVRRQSHHGRRSCASTSRASPKPTPCPASGFDPTSLGFPSYIAGDSPYLQMPVVASHHLPEPGRGRRQQLSVAIAASYSATWSRPIGNHTIKFGADAAAVPHELYRRRLFHRRITASATPGSAPRAARRARWRRARISRRSCWACPPPAIYDLESYGSFYNYYAALFIQDDWRVRQQPDRQFRTAFRSRRRRA